MILKGLLTSTPSPRASARCLPLALQQFAGAASLQLKDGSGTCAVLLAVLVVVVASETLLVLAVLLIKSRSPS